MNVNSINNSTASKYKIISKYFSCYNSKSHVMDESFSDFQQKKKHCNGPKNIKLTNKSKVKKSVKRIKGQKDIRTALKLKNELVSYTKEFNNVCVQSGVDIDSEQLQLAIALSASIQETEVNAGSCISQFSKTLSSQERIGRIRTTLKEYGFQVPDVKALYESKKTKRTKKNYKLLLTPEIQKQQLIADKYSQILFHNNNIHNINTDLLDISKVPLYYVSTNITYEAIKCNNIFYVTDLVEQTPSSLGCMLRSWSEIPGRPESPIFNKETIKLDGINCTQDELDNLLSGTIKTAKDIIETKLSIFHEAGIICQKKFIKNYNIEKEVGSHIHIKKPLISFTLNVKAPVFIQKVNMDSENFDILNSHTKLNILSNRSKSPDIFDDESSTLIESTFENIDIVPKDGCNNKITINNTSIQKSSMLSSCLDMHKLNSQFIESHVTEMPSNNSMETTKCVIPSVDLTQKPNDNSQKAIRRHSMFDSELSHETNITKRPLNDFMDLTECVVNSKPFTEHNIDLTQSDNKEKDNNADVRNVETLDLTMSTNSNDDTLPFVQICGNDSKNISLNNTIILNDEFYDQKFIKFGNFVNQQEVSVILTPKSKHCHKAECRNAKNNIVKSPIVRNTDKFSQNNIFEEYIYPHSENSGNSITTDNTNLKDLVNENIDLTQSSSSSDDKLITDNNQISYKNNYIGKNDNVSIDYDDIVFHKEVHSITEPSEELDNLDDVSSLHSSQKSEVFGIKDIELNYSIQRSKCTSNENFLLGGISIMDNLSEIKDYNKCKEECMLHDKSPPAVNIKSNCFSENDCNNSNETTLVRSRDNTVAPAKTPENSNYIIKTNGITPILDYGSMPTPKVHEELDKYGLKPFKRKRAIQLLTHIYNQTHPLVEEYVSEDLPSTSKKLKEHSTLPSISSKQLLSPKKYQCSGGYEKENNLYRVTNELPNITNIECNVDDWVFYKKEKAKVHTCCVPLHIAFHNYVTCRRKLWEAILRLEPVNIDEIYRELAASGYKYDPKDLLRFLDKKCITVKTADKPSQKNFKQKLIKEIDYK